jgi:hypothetical protein
MRDGVTYMGDSLFINTDYSFNKAVENTYNYAAKLIVENGGNIGANEITIAKQTPESPPLEVSFPDVVLDKKISIFEKDAWEFTGDWKTYQRIGWPDEKLYNQARYAEKSGDAVEVSFFGSGISIDGNWFKDGGRADVFLDGEFVRTIDTYFFYNKQEHDNITLWHVTDLPAAQHRLKLIVKGEKNQESLGTKIYITQAIIYKTALKKSASYKFSFKK